MLRDLDPKDLGPSECKKLFKEFQQELKRLAEQFDLRIDQSCCSYGPNSCTIRFKIN